MTGWNTSSGGIGFTAVLVLSLLVAPVTVRSEQAAKPVRIGRQSPISATTDGRVFEGFRQALHERGWVEGRNLAFEYRFADGQLAGLPVLAAEIAGLKPEVALRFSAADAKEIITFAGKRWVRVLPEHELEVEEWRIVEMEDYDVVVLRHAEGFFAFNNACPHLHLPLFDRRELAEGALGNYAGTDTLRPINSTVTEDRGLICRWHTSCFELQTGEARDWATRLQEDGTSPGWEFLGDISKNRSKFAGRLDASDGEVAVFANLGGDATLVAPRARGDVTHFGHLASFSRGAGSRSNDELGRSVG